MKYSPGVTHVDWYFWIVREIHTRKQSFADISLDPDREMQSRWKYVERHFALSEQCSNGQCTEFCRFLKSCKYWKFSRWPNLRFGSTCAFFLRRVSEGSTSCYVVGSNFGKVSRSKCRNMFSRITYFWKKWKTFHATFKRFTSEVHQVHRFMNFVERTSTS